MRVDLLNHFFGESECQLMLRLADEGCLGNFRMVMVLLLATHLHIVGLDRFIDAVSA